MKSLRLPTSRGAALGFPSRCLYFLSPPGFAQRERAVVSCVAWTLFNRGRPSSGILVEEEIGSPKFLENPSVPLPCSQTPVGLSLQAIAECRCCPRLSDDEGSNGYHGIEAQSHGFGTCSIRFVPPSRVTTQCSLPAGGQPLPDGSGYPLGSNNVFRSISISMFYIFFLTF